MSRLKIIFILHNIYESINGVSNKYIKFINHLTNLSHEVILFTTFKDNAIYNTISNSNKNIKIIKVNGLNVPLYKEIKIPIIKYSAISNEIINGNEIIIFNGEFIWIYDILKSLKNKYKNIKIYPNMHTDYEYYLKYSYTKFNLLFNLNYLNYYLETKLFNGIIVTGNKMVLKYKDYTESIFNANEVNLQLYSNMKSESWNTMLDNVFNVIYCGRVSKEKNIDEFLECCDLLYKTFSINNNKSINNIVSESDFDNYDIEYNINKKNENKYIEFIYHIIGDGPFISNLQNIIDIQYKEIKYKIIFHGKMSGEDINSLYQRLNNRMFIFTSLSETFGKTPLEAASTGIPIFIKRSDITDDIYIDKKNAFVFNDKNDFIDKFKYFINLNSLEKQIFITNSIENTKKYDQNIIFNDWIHFLINGTVIKDKAKINFYDMITLFGISKFVSCSGMIAGE